MKKDLIKIVFISLVSLTIISCNHDSSEVNDTIDSTDCACIDNKYPLSVSIYLDNTVSMEGYFKTDNSETFSASINAVAGYWQTYNANIDAYYTEAKTENKKKVTTITNVVFDTMMSKISSKNVKFTDSYHMNVFFDHVVSKISNDSVNGIAFFFTDGILSGTNEEINSNPEYSKVNASTLEARIASALRPLTNKTCPKYAAAVYQFESGFKGDYIKYNNKHQKIDRQRPYYVIVVGDNILVSQFDSVVNSGLKDFKPLHSVLFNQPTMPFAISTSSSVDSDSPQNVIKVKLDNEGEYVNFAARAEMLPSYLLDTAYINNIIKVNFLRQADIPVSLNSMNIYFNIRPESGIDDQKLEIKIYDQLPQWIEQYTITDDSKIGPKPSLCDNKTFLLVNLLNGIKKGIYNNNGGEIFMQKNYIIDTKL